MKLSFLKRRWQRIALRIVLIFTAVVLVAAFFINLYWSPILANRLKSTVLSSSDSLYKIDFTDADLHVLQGKIVIFNLDLQADTAVYNARRKANLAPNNLYRLHIKKLVLKQIHPFTLYFKQKLNIGEIILSAPELNISYQLNHTKDTTEKDTRNLYQRIAKTLRSIHVDHINLNDVKFKYEDYSGHKVVISELKEMNLSASDLLIDSASMTDKSRFLYCSDITAELNNFSGKTLNGLYKYKMELLKFSTRTSQLNAQNITLQPISPELFFDKSRHDRFTMHVDSLQLNHFDFFTYHKYRRFKAGSLIINQGDVAIFNNPKRKDSTHVDTTDRTSTFPNAGIFKLKTDMAIDTILLNHIDVTYTELSRKSHKMGYITFNNTSGQIFNVTTNADALKKNNNCTLYFSTYFMNKGKLDANFKFDLTDKNLGYTYNGHLGPVNLSVVNTAAMSLAMVKIKSGTLKSLDFDIQGNRYLSKGKVSLLYNDLKVTLLKPDTMQKKLKRMRIESFFANIFIIKHNNPDREGEPARSYYVNEKRPPEFAFFKTVWKTLLIGMRSCAGYGVQKEKEIKSQLADRATKKQEHKLIKAERKQKRAEKKKERELKKELKNAAPEE
jgi:hypothetical protein